MTWRLVRILETPVIRPTRHTGVVKKLPMCNGDSASSRKHNTESRLLPYCLKDGEIYMSKDRNMYYSQNYKYYKIRGII